MNKLFNKNFWLGFVSGIVFFILLIMLLVLYIGCNPITDCESCANGLTP